MAQRDRCRKHPCKSLQLKAVEHGSAKCAMSRVEQKMKVLGDSRSILGLQRRLQMLRREDTKVAPNLHQIRQISLSIRLSPVGDDPAVRRQRTGRRGGKKNGSV